jgi:hypothetical protein
MATDRAAYMRAYRATPEGRAQLLAQKRREQAKRLAVTILIAKYPREYDHLFSTALRAIEEKARCCPVDD